MKEKYMKDFNGEKVFSLEYDKETLRDMVLDKQEEIKRLKEDNKELSRLYTRANNEFLSLYSIIKEVREYIPTCGCDDKAIDHIEEILDKVEENK